ncbi:EF-hand domain-containing protein, partial [Mycobacterium tuberculosis]
NKATTVSPTAAAFLAQFATEGNDSVSWAQFEAFRKQRYADTDRNQDGHVDEQEYVDEYLQRFDVRLADARAGHLRQTDTRFKALDRDGNGAISRAEYDAAGERTWAGYERSQNATQETAAASSRDPLKMPTSHTANGMLDLYDRNKD